MKVLLVWLLLQQDTPIFKGGVRLVEVYATVFDSRGKFADGLTRDRFKISENGAPVQIVSFAAEHSPLTCAILLDTTGSMSEDLPAVKNSINRLIGELGSDDQVAVFGFSQAMVTLQDFTTDKKAAMTAVLRSRAAGTTALFDAMSQAARALAQKPGRKVLVVFTDGKDNASVLNASAATRRAKQSGVPVYTVAQGAATREGALKKQLAEIAKSTGGKSYEATKRKEVEEVFQDISGDMRHMYLLAYPAPNESDTKWHAIQVAVSGLKDGKIRAKEGYFLD